MGKFVGKTKKVLTRLIRLVGGEYEGRIAYLEKTAQETQMHGQMFGGGVTGEILHQNFMNLEQRVYAMDSQSKVNMDMLWNSCEEMLFNLSYLLKTQSATAAADGQQPRLRKDALSLEESYQELERLVPEAYHIWQKLFEHGKTTYETDPEHNLVVTETRFVKEFQAFAKIYLKPNGYLLDIGCGPQPLPTYLQDYPLELIRGMDPLPPFEKHPFEFTQNIAEFIPYEDETFMYVLTVTSLDHILLLDRALEEIHRVLKPEGMFLIWAGEIVGQEDCEKYDPYRHPRAVDENHMFHIKPVWFEEMAEELFIQEGHFLDRYGCHYYAYKKRG